MTNNLQKDKMRHYRRRGKYQRTKSVSVAMRTITVLILAIIATEGIEHVASSPSTPVDANDLESDYIVEKFFEQFSSRVVKSTNDWKYAAGLPSYVLKISDEDMLFLGPSANDPNWYSIMAKELLENECYQSKITFTIGNFNLYSVNFKVKNDICKEEGIFVIYRTLKGEAVKAEFDLDDLPDVFCHASDSAVKTVLPFLYPPGLQFGLCNNCNESITCSTLRIGNNNIEQSVTKFDSMGSVVSKPELGNCLEFYLRPAAVKCVDMVSKRKLKTEGCSVEVVRDQASSTSEVIVTVKQSGSVKMVTSLSTKTDICSKECTYIVGDVSYVIVTCPDGSEHKFEGTRDMLKECTFSRIPYFGYLAQFVCRCTHRPTVAFLLVGWVILGTVAVSLLFAFTSWLLDKVSSLQTRTLLMINPELGRCETCEGKILRDDDIHNHEVCAKGCCAYCRKNIDIGKLAVHVSSCACYFSYVSTGNSLFDASNTAGEKLKRFFTRMIIKKYTNTIIYYFVILILVLVIFSPVSASTATKQFTVVNSPEEFAVMYEMKQLDFYTQLKTELYNCSSCLALPEECSCSSSEKDGNRQVRHKRSSTSKAQEFVDKKERSRELQTIKSGWSAIQTQDLYSLAVDDRSLSVTFSTFKKEKNILHTSGFIQGTLKLNKYSGQIWNVVNKDSIERHTVSVHLADTYQVYDLSLKFYTASRKVSTWFRGACTGDCPSSCGCVSQTCHHKLWNYDRGWGCNPTWCWSSNAGCSCCAADLDHHQRNWVVGVYEAEYRYTEMVFCIKTLTKMLCKTISDNSQVQFDEGFINVKKASSVEQILPKTIAVVWHNDDSHHLQFKHPDYIWLAPEICGVSCNHGIPGDYKTWNFELASGIYGAKDDKQLQNFKYLSAHDGITKREVPQMDKKTHSEFIQQKIDDFRQTTTFGPHKEELDSNEVAEKTFSSTTDGENQVGNNGQGIKIRQKRNDHSRHAGYGTVYNKEKMENLGLLPEIEKERKRRKISFDEEMSWSGVETEHICHTGSWPDCDYYELVPEQLDQYKQLNRTSVHLQEKFEEVSVRLTSNFGGALKVRPKMNIGNVDYTLKLSDFEFQSAKIKADIIITPGIKKTCQGCYGCTSGFECTFELTSKSEADHIMYCTTENLFCRLDQGGILVKGRKTITAHIRGVCTNPVDNLDIKLAASGITIELSISTRLQEPDHKLVRVERVINLNNYNYGQQGCVGWKWFSCLGSNLKNFFSVSFGWLVHLFKYGKIVVIVLITLLLAAIALYCLSVMARLMSAKIKPNYINIQRYKQEKKKKEKNQINKLP